MGETVKQNPIEEELDTGLNSLVRSISIIHDHVRNMTSSQYGIYSSVLDGDVKNGTKEITYENLLDKIKLAQNKIKAIQSKVSETMTDLEQNWPQANITRHRISDQVESDSTDEENEAKEAD